MAHYAFLDANNVVVKVITGVDEDVTQNGVGGSTEAWEQFYESQEWNAGLTCRRTSYNATNGYRKQYAGVGFTYNSVADVFISPSPYPSWTLDTNYDWQPPTPKPSADEPYEWSEEDLVWVAV